MPQYATRQTERMPEISPETMPHNSLESGAGNMGPLTMTISQENLEVRPPASETSVPTRVREGLSVAKSLGLQARRRRQRQALKLYSASGQLTKSLEAAGVQSRQHYRWLAMDPWYKAAFLKARAAVADVVEQELLTRAVQGYTETTTSEKWGVTVVEKKSDKLLEIAARALLRDRGYGQDVQLSGTLQVQPVKALSDEELEAQINVLLEKRNAIEGQVMK